MAVSTRVLPEPQVWHPKIRLSPLCMNTRQQPRQNSECASRTACLSMLAVLFRSAAHGLHPIASVAGRL